MQYVSFIKRHVRRWCIAVKVLASHVSGPGSITVSGGVAVREEEHSAWRSLGDRLEIRWCSG